MKKSPIDKIKLSQMLRAGKTPAQCAQYFGVSPSAISHAKKKLNISVVKSVALENAHRVVDKNLNAVDQLQKINNDANELLDLCMAWQRGDDVAMQILESQRTKRVVRIGNEEIPIEEFRFKDPRELALKAMGEIRNQLKLQLEIFQCLYDLKAVQAFQEEVLSAIGEADQNVRDRIISALNKKQAIRSAVKFT